MFRNASQSWFTKILFGAIIFSFCLWGVGDIIRNYSASKPVIKVNKATITSEGFSREYSQTKQRIMNSGAVALTEEDLKNIDIKKIVTDRLISECVFDQTFQKHHIVTSKKLLSRIIESIPEFQKDGIFDANLYTLILQRSGLSESAFLKTIEKDTLKRQLTHPIFVGYKIPTFIKNMIVSEFDLKRTLIVGRVKTDGMSIDTEISESDIEEFYTSNIDKYKKPEKRDVSVLVIDYSTLSKDLKISKEEIKEYYEANKESFQFKESRDFERLTFETPDQADKIWKMLKKNGAAIKDIIKKHKVKTENLDGMEQQSFLPRIGEELFVLKKNEVSNIYNVGDLYYIYIVKKIERSDKRSQEDINEEIKEILKNEKINTPEFYQKIKVLKNKIDDSFAAGASIEEVSRITKMPIVKVKGLTPTVTSIKEINDMASDEPTRKELREAIFGTPEGQASTTIESHDIDTLSFVVFVNKVVKEHVQSLKSIHDTVTSDFKSEKKKEKARDTVEKIVDITDDPIKNITALKNAQTFKVSKKDLVMQEKSPSKDVKDLLEIIPDVNVIMDLIASLKVGRAQYFLDKNEDFIVVGVKDEEKSSKPDSSFNNFVLQYIDDGAMNDIARVTSIALKSQQPVEISDEALNKIAARMRDDDNGEE
jgi:peptidyl-prolyl cis-trans isomerase D